MLLLDEKSGRIQASVKQGLLPDFEPQLKDGRCYIMQKLLVGRNETLNPTINGKFKLGFMKVTQITETEDGNIPPNAFDFVPFPQILSSVKEGQLLELIGHVVEKSDIKEITSAGGKTNRLIDVVLEDLESNKLPCTLWGTFADNMNQYLIEQGDKGPVIVILQLCKLKVSKGTKGISNAFNETKLLINPKFKEDLQYKEKLQHADEPLSQVVSYSSGQGVMSFREDILSTERMTISDIIDCSRDCFVAVLATIFEIDYHKGWFYKACRKCKKKVTSVGKKYSCLKCEGMIAKIYCFKLQVYVIDSTGSAQFSLFNRTISNLIGKSASELVNPTTKGNNSDAYPIELDQLKDKEFLFKVSVSEYNIEQSWQGYPVSNMTDDAELIEEFKNLHSVKGNNKEDGLEMRADFMTEVDDNMKNNLSQQEDANSVQILVEKVDGTPSSKTPNETISKTPSIKTPKKRMAESVDITEDSIDLGTQTSSTKIPKLATIKKEPDN